MMNYERIHQQFLGSRIERHGRLKTLHQAKRIASNAASHAHHIVPRCMGGSDKGSNLIILTPREHFFIHKLLWKIHGGKMALALLYMSRTDNHDGIITSRQYEIIYQQSMELRRGSEWSENVKKAAARRKVDPVWLQKNRESVRRTVATPEWRENMLKAAHKRSLDPEWLKNTRAATKRTVRSEKWINNQRAGIEAMKASDEWPVIVAKRAKAMTENKNWQEHKRRLEIKNCKPAIGFNVNDGSVVVLLGTKEKFAFPINPADICACITGKQKTAKGHTWRYATYEEVENYRPGHEWLELNKPA